jgi:hypothetical protein
MREFSDFLDGLKDNMINRQFHGLLFGFVLGLVGIVGPGSVDSFMGRE